MSRVFRIIANMHAVGGGELSTINLMKMAMKLGHHVIFHPTRSITPQLRIPEGVEIGDSLEKSPKGDSDFLVFYGNDAVYKMLDRRKMWEDLFRRSRRNTIVLNFVMGEAWNFSDYIHRYLFLNTAKEYEVVNRLQKKDMAPRPTLSMPPPVDLTPYLSLDLPDYSKLNFARTGRYSGKYDEADYTEILNGWMDLSPESHYYFMASPPWMKKKFSSDKRFHLYDWNGIPVDDLLKECSLYHYRLPMTMRDQGPRVIVEAMARGLPCIGEPRDGALDRITPETGWLCWDNKEFIGVVKEILDNPGLLEKKGKAARERARHEFNPWRWMAHITGEDISEEYAGVDITVESDGHLIEAQKDLLENRDRLFEFEKRFKGKKKKKSSKVEETKNDLFSFGGGNLRDKEWEVLKNYIAENQVKEILDIGGVYSVTLFQELGLQVLNLDNRREIVDAINARQMPGVSAEYYTYPYFPKIEKRFDLAFVDGPGPHNHDGRAASLEFAKEHADVIFLRDSTRKAESESSKLLLSSDKWYKTPFPQGLAMFIRRGR